VTTEQFLTASAAFNIVLAAALAVIGIWSAFRELHIRDLGKELSRALSDMLHGYNRITDIAEAISVRIADMATLTRESKKELMDLVKEQKREQAELMLDIERRLTRSLDLVRDGRTGTQVNFHGGAHGTQVGDSNQQQ
jgi:hypothetical protein